MPRWPEISLEERFWSKADRRTGCWPWLGSVNHAGYGQFNGKPRWPRCMLAHRVAWILTYGEDYFDGLDVLHKCDNPRCVNPNHLFLGTEADNMRDLANKDRHRRNDTEYLPTGLKHHYGTKGTKLTLEDAISIRGDTRMQIDIAKEYGVHQSLICRIKSGKYWNR